MAAWRVLAKQFGLPALAAALALIFTPGVPAAQQAPDVPVKGMVTLVDIGAKTCIPCKMMAPVLEALESEYRGRAAVVFIDVREQPGEVGRFGIRAIPTQIFYDREGKEVLRHEGFLAKEPIAETLDKLLAK